MDESSLLRPLHVNTSPNMVRYPPHRGKCCDNRITGFKTHDCYHKDVSTPDSSRSGGNPSPDWDAFLNMPSASMSGRSSISDIVMGKLTPEERRLPFPFPRRSSGQDLQAARTLQTFPCAARVFGAEQALFQALTIADAQNVEPTTSPIQVPVETPQLVGRKRAREDTDGEDIDSRTDDLIEDGASDNTEEPTVLHFCESLEGGSCVPSTPRKLVSDYFGRNKRETKTIPENAWLTFCRKHYQRGVYHSKRNDRNFLLWKIEHIMNQIERATRVSLAENDPILDWKIQFNASLRRKLTRDNARLPTVIDVYVARKFESLVGPNKSTEEVLDFVMLAQKVTEKAIQDFQNNCLPEGQMPAAEMKEYASWNKAVTKYPDLMKFELLPRKVVKIQKPKSKSKPKKKARRS